MIIHVRYHDDVDLFITSAIALLVDVVEKPGLTVGRLRVVYDDEREDEYLDGYETVTVTP